jgi:hypothetical protein
MSEDQMDSLNLKDTSGYERILESIIDDARRGGEKSLAFQVLRDYKELMAAKFREDEGGDPLDVKMAAKKVEKAKDDPAYKGYIARLESAYKLCIKDEGKSINGFDDDEIIKQREGKVTQGIFTGYIAESLSEITDPIESKASNN